MRTASFLVRDNWCATPWTTLECSSTGMVVRGMANGRVGDVARLVTGARYLRVFFLIGCTSSRRQRGLPCSFIMTPRQRSRDKSFDVVLSLVRRQQTIALSSGDAECDALGHGSAAGVFLRQVAVALGFFAGKSTPAVLSDSSTARGVCRRQAHEGVHVPRDQALAHHSVAGAGSRGRPQHGSGEKAAE